MTWIKLDDKFPRHPKIAGLSDRAFRVWVSALCYASEFLTDGAIPSSFLIGIKPAVREELMNAGLWRLSDDESRVEIHNYLKHQRDKASIQEQRTSGKRRQERFRNGVTESVTEPLVTPLVTPPIYDSVSNSVTASVQNKNVNEVRRERFDRFWAVYPRKVGKEAAWKEWLKLDPSDDMTAGLMEAVLKQRQTDTQWMKEGGQFIPHPRTWLSQGRWQDEALDIPQLSDKTVRNLKVLYGPSDFKPGF